LGIDADEAVDIAKKFIQLNSSFVDIVNKTLRGEIWCVKVFLTSFGQQSSRMLLIESKTGRIIGFE
jgi:hypothetical protein